MEISLNHRETKNKRKLFSVYTVYLVSGIILFLEALQTILAVNDLWPFGPSEPWMILFIFIWTLVMLRLLSFLPFIVRSLHRSFKPYSLSLPAIMAVALVVISMSVMLPMFLDPLTIRGENKLVNILFVSAAVGFSVSAISCGLYGLRKLWKKEWTTLNPAGEDLTGVRGPAKVLYWLYVLSGIMMLLNAIPFFVEDWEWAPFLGFGWTVRLFSLLNLLLLAIPFVYVFNFWFLRYVIRHFKKVPDLSVPLLLMILGFLGFLPLEGVDYPILLISSAIVIFTIGLLGLYHFKRKFPKSNQST